MFSPEVVARAEFDLRASLGDGVQLIRRPIAECWSYRDQLADAYDAKSRPTRPLTTDEENFIASERLLSRIDFRYWVERYAIVAKETQDAEPLTPLWASQELLLSRLAALEDSRYMEGHPDGILINVLKARQLGMSTLTEVILAHRVTTQRSVRGLVAADVQEQSEYMFSMAELVINQLPWWLRPPLKARNIGQYWASTTESSLIARWGKSSRGKLQDRDGVKGNIGRGKTYGILHLSELSTWERPEQIDDGLLPGVPVRPRTFCVFESTAKGRHDWWHKQWADADRSLGRFINIFIPWYIEPEKYWLPVPQSWEPAGTTVAHATLVERTSPTFLLGRTVRLSREQLYWYERTRALWTESDSLDRNQHKFLEEYPAVPEEAFQHSGRTVFPASTLERIRTQARPPVAVCYVQPAKDIATLKEWERDMERRQQADAPAAGPDV